MANQQQQQTSDFKRRSSYHTQQAPDLSQVYFGQVQPQAIPLEEAVLGAIMLDREALPLIVDLIRPETFYTEQHQCIYGAILELYEKSEPIDLLTVTEQLRQNSKLDAAGGVMHLVEISNRVASSANIEYHCRIIVQKYIQRCLIKISTNTIKNAYGSMDVFELVDQAEQELFSVVSGTVTTAVKNSSRAVSEFLANLEFKCKKAAENTGVTGVPSSMQSINAITAGWQKSDFIVVAARPGMGKTAYIIGEAMHAAKSGNPVAIFTLEMPTDQIVSREIVQETGIAAEKLKRGTLSDSEWQLIQEASETISGLPIFIDDTSGLSIMQLRAKCRRLKKKENIQLIIVDYLQLMTNEAKIGNREQEISSISRGLKLLAKELQVPVIALSQLSRAVETRGGSKRPQLSDLRESGSLEQDADLVAFLYRAEYYGIFEDEHGQSLKGISEFIVAKHRNGALDTAKMAFRDTCAKFCDLEDNTFSTPAKSTPAVSYPNPATKGGDAGFPTTFPASILTQSRRTNDEDIPF